MVVTSYYGGNHHIFLIVWYGSIMNKEYNESVSFMRGLLVTAPVGALMWGVIVWAVARWVCG